MCTWESPVNSLLYTAVGLAKIDLEGDFDPDAHDKQMAEIFDDKYYEGQDTEKPVWEDDIETGYEDENEQYDDKGEIMMDADYLPGGEKYEAEKNKKKRKRPGDSEETEDTEPAKRAKAEFQKLLDEYYSLNYEDVIGGDLPTRFKYRKVEPEDYGLSAVEILLADDKALNNYVGMKQLAP